MTKWDKPDIPHKGWMFIDIEDVGEFYEQCEMCGQEKIRFVHILKHHEYPFEIRVGCDCASKMLNDYINPQKREREFKNKLNRFKTFSKIKWSHNGIKNTYSAKYKGEYITIIKSRYGNYGIVFQNEWYWKFNGETVRDFDTALKFAFSIFDENHKVYNDSDWF